MRNFILIVIAGLVLAGCASPQIVSQEEYINFDDGKKGKILDMTTRPYRGVTQEQVFQAAENFFILLDGDDFDITHSNNKVKGIRNFVFFIMSGTDDWEVTTAPASNGGYQVSVKLLNGMSTALNHSKRKVVYDVFWARMDYLLGKRVDWLSCDKVSEMLRDGETWGDPLSVCDEKTLKNNKPEPRHVVQKN